MNGSLFANPDEGAIYFSRTDPDHLLAAWSPHGFVLEGKEWPTVEHYFQAMKFENETYQEKIRTAESPKKARQLGRNRFKKIRKDWKKVKVVYMTRALYTKCKAYPDVSQELLKTDAKKLVENSVYDYFWGCGRDRRGANMYGQVLMNIRDKLREEAQP